MDDPYATAHIGRVSADHQCFPSRPRHRMVVPATLRFSRATAFVWIPRPDRMGPVAIQGHVVEFNLLFPGASEAERRRIR